MSRVIEKFQEAQVRKDLPTLRAGDTVRVHVRLKEGEGEKERIQPFEGVVIKKRGKSTGASFTVRRVSFGVGIERVFPFNSPSISSIEVLRQGRVRRAKLTRKGLREVARLDRLSDDFAASVLVPLTGAQRDRLIAAMVEVERLMRASAVRIEVGSADAAEAQWCLEQYFRELASRFDTGFDPSRSISANVDELTPPAGVFVIARLVGEPVGCGALKVKERKIGEIKRMWVRSDARGLGVGRRILEMLESVALEFDVAVLRLETNRTLVEAQALYRNAGYREVAPFNDEPYAHHWFEKALR